MPITKRTEWENFPGAVTYCDMPLGCQRYPTIQQLGAFLMSAGIAEPSTIIGGIIYTEETRFNLLTIHCPF
ncbi:MAG: hypothetical protein KAY24_20185 [Candidatus Eisenbacteria sp.]|nr:hypothetical protein [Candidatus Eisenbacteria bacterium]